MKNAEKQSQKYQVPAVVRAFRLIETLSHSPGGMTITELSQALRLPLSSTSALLKTLHSIGYLIKENSTFTLGTRLLEVGNRALHSLELSRVMEQPLRQLVDQVQITAQGAVLEGTSAVVVQKIEPSSSSFIKINTYVGRRAPLHCTALGKILLAYQPEEKRDSIIRSAEYTHYTRNTITGPDEFRKVLAKVHSQGFAVDDEEEEIGIRCVGAPVFDKNGEIAAAVSLCGTTSQLRISNLTSLIQLIQETGDSISKRMGYSENVILEASAQSE